MRPLSAGSVPRGQAGGEGTDFGSGSCRFRPIGTGKTLSDRGTDMSRFGVLAGGWSRCRLLVVWAAVWAMVSSLGAVSSAQAAVVKATLSLSPSTAIRGESVKATGRVPGAVSRPGWGQRKSGTRWVTVAKTKTTRTGSYASKFKAPAAGSYSVRTLAPRCTIARKARAQYVTSTRTLRVVAQTASLALPATLVTGKV